MLRCETANAHRSSTGVREQGMWTKGPPGTWEALSSPLAIRPEKGKPVEKPWPDVGITYSI
jgi:hypothetical protein